MKHLKKYNESLDESDWQPAKEVFINAINTDKPMEYNEPRLSPYIEDGQLKPAKFIICYELDMEGRYRTGTVGTYPILPEHFDIRVKKTYNGKKTYYETRLSAKGKEYLKLQGPCTQWYDLVDEEYIQNLITKNEKSIASYQRSIDKYKKLLGK